MTPKQAPKEPRRVITNVECLSRKSGSSQPALTQSIGQTISVIVCDIILYINIKNREKIVS